MNLFYPAVLVATLSLGLKAVATVVHTHTVKQWSVGASASAHLGNPCREQRSYFAVYFTAGFNNKTVPCTMNELYLTGATREAACAHCTMRKYSRKCVTQKPRPSEA